VAANSVDGGAARTTSISSSCSELIKLIYFGRSLGGTKAAW
jgi:hypothetical protein